MNKNFNKKNKGITLVALVVTIILLLILAGISIASLTGSGLFENARLAEQKSKEATEKEEGILSDYENKIGQYIDADRATSSADLELDFDNQIDIIEYNSTDNCFTIPRQGIINIIIPYGNKYGSFLVKYKDNNINYYQGGSNSVANLVDSVPVYKGMKVWVYGDIMDVTYIPVKD